MADPNESGFAATVFWHGPRESLSNTNELSTTINHRADCRYSDGCRCDECREAHKLKARELPRPEAAWIDAPTDGFLKARCSGAASLRSCVRWWTTAPDMWPAMTVQFDNV
jgi:hypothetical protein